MHDHLKTLASLLMLLGVGAAVVGAYVLLTATRRHPQDWSWLLIAGALALLACGALLMWRLHRRPDEAPDYLRQMFRGVFRRPLEANGLCFTIVPEANQGVAELHIYFQSRYSAPSEVRLMLRRDHGVAWSHKQLQIATVRFTCEGGAFGLLCVPFGVPAKLQGRRRRFAVGATITYPDGRGRMIRFKSGRMVGTGDIGAGTLAAAHLLGGAAGAIAASRQGARRFHMRYPSGVAETAPAGSFVRVETLWRPGDPEIDLEQIPGTA